MNSTDPTPAEIKQFNQSLEDAQRTYTNSYNQSITDENPTLCPTKMRNDPMYIRYYILLANFFMMGLLPFIILAVTNFLLYKTVTSSSTLASRATARQKRDQSIAKMLVFIVVVFVCCNVVRMVLNLYEVLQALLVGANGPLMEEWPDWCNALAMLSTLLLTLNSSTNILIYCWKDKTFRDQLFITLGLKKLSHTQSIMMTTLTVSAGVAERRAVVV
ncbi:FMRFamide receptor [Eurytemora carolleeae]|uniref:FMRFamide receptor n=1 Tax=Eurytemora carolleeae TaxID=1294199 RepID=UPI000C76B867|nr:FMRFamide receptor [Eurytemora carolleeae]|eukprot:XP_023336275.1 FMRFamide receptor-like [Eurytemora affinis]